MIDEAFLLYLRRNGVLFLLNESMRNHTSFRIGGPADIMILPKTSDEILGIVDAATISKVPLFVVGNGTKLLVGNNGIRGAVIKISKNFSRICVLNGTITAEAGSSLQDLIKTAEQHSIGGLEFAAGIPGTIGGAIVMNAGTAEGEIKDVVHSVTAISMKTGKLITISNEQCKFAYRESIFQKEPMIILSARLSLVRGDRAKIRRRIDDLTARRMKTQPLDKPNAGSIFRNPLGSSAGQLIEASGLKGMTIGCAQISKKHANFIVNLGDATCDEVHGLIKHAQEEVKAKYGIDLALELRIVGE